MRTLAALLIMVWAWPVLADTDYKCLSDCVNNGGTPASCMDRCSYVQPKPEKPFDPAAQRTSTNDVHRTVSTPVNGQGMLYNTPKAAKGPEVSKDYQCLAKCQQDKMQPALCEKLCYKESKKALLKRKTN